MSFDFHKSRSFDPLSRRVWLAGTAAGLALAGGGCGVRVKVPLKGAGATFPAPLFDRWFAAYYRLDPQVKINYQGLGSSAGIKQIIAGNQIDFGASDAAMTDKEMAQVERGVLLLPVTAGKIVLAYNIPGVNNIQLSRDAYAGIFLGQIKRWNDPRLVDCNPGVQLPDLPITVVYRAGGSGTTFVFTKHLSTISNAWKDGPGEGQSVNWPTGIGARGNDGITTLVQRNPGAIGYIEYGFAKLSHLPTALLQNRDGRYVTPTSETGRNALASEVMPSNLRLWIPDPRGQDCYPIVTYSWMLLYKTYPAGKRATGAEVVETVKKIVTYCLTDGQKAAEDLGYIPLPDPVSKAGLAALDQIKPA